MANKNINWKQWLMCLTAIASVVLASLILSKVNNKCGKK